MPFACLVSSMATSQSKASTPRPDCRAASSIREKCSRSLASALPSRSRYLLAAARPVCPDMALIAGMRVSSRGRRRACRRA